MYTLMAITANRLEVDLQTPSEAALWGRGLTLLHLVHTTHSPTPKQFKITTHTLSVLWLRHTFDQSPSLDMHKKETKQQP